METTDLDKTIEEQNSVVAIPPLPYKYDPSDDRVVEILSHVATFCGKEFIDDEPEDDKPIDKPDEGGDNGNQDDNGGNGKEPNPDEGAATFNDTPSETEPTNPEPTPGVGDGGEDTEPKEDSENVKEQKATYWTMLWQVLRYLSSVACWTEEADDTFILQQRTQTFSTKQERHACDFACNPCEKEMVVIPLEYSPLQGTLDPIKRLDHYFFPKSINPFIGGRITVYVRGKRCEADITSEYLLEHYDPADEKVHIDRQDFPELFLVNGCCDCEREANITLWYNAGYLTVPEGLLPLICPLIQKITDSKMSINECANVMDRVSGLLKRKKIGNVQYEWSDSDNALNQTEAMYVELFNLSNMAELYAISRCELVAVEEAGDVV